MHLRTEGINVRLISFMGSQDNKTGKDMSTSRSTSESDLPVAQRRSRIVRKTIFRYLLDDIGRTFAMWFCQVLLVWTATAASFQWISSWLALAALIGLGVLVVGGTTINMPIIAHPDFPTGYSVWTPIRSMCFVTLYLGLWAITGFLLYGVG